ncbi:MAG: glycosyltransferase family 2 protein [Promethearchaeota archaeon]
MSLLNLNEIELIIEDNSSTDSTKEIINSYKGINIPLIDQNRNLNFAKASNNKVLKTKGDFIFIANQDIKFPKDFFEIILKEYYSLKNNREIVLYPLVLFFNKYINYYNAKIRFLGFSYTPKMNQIIPQEEKSFKTKRASGFSMFLKRDVFFKLNDFNPYFFRYHEDTDFSLNALRNNLEIYITNKTHLKHQKFQMMLNNFTCYYFERNSYLLLDKNIKTFRCLIPYTLILKLMRLFQSILTKKLKIRLWISKFLIQKNKQLRYMRAYKLN